MHKTTEENKPVVGVMPSAAPAANTQRKDLITTYKSALVRAARWAPRRVSEQQCSRTGWRIKERNQCEDIRGHQLEQGSERAGWYRAQLPAASPAPCASATWSKTA